MLSKIFTAIRRVTAATKYALWLSDVLQYVPKSYEKIFNKKLEQE